MNLFISTLVLIIIAFTLGIIVGLLVKGIHIHHHTESTKPAPKEYNQSTAQHLPPNMQKYAQENKGFIDI